MKRTIIVVLGAIGLLTGCFGAPHPDPYASVDYSRHPLQAQCEARGGYWNRNADVCEAPLFRW